MQFLPKPYQPAAIEFLRRTPRCFLEGGIGSGKTAIALTVGAELYLSLEVNKVLLVSTTNVIHNTFPEEMQKWDHLQGLSYTILHGDGGKRNRRLTKDTIFYFINYEGLPWLVKQHKRPFFDLIIFDESQLVKALKTTRFKVCRFLAQRAPRVICMTGTPIGNSLQDLWTQFYLLDQGQRLFPNFYEFQRFYFYQTDYMGYKWEPHDWARARIIEQIADITFQIHNSEIEKTKLTERVYYVDLPPEARETYLRMERDMLLEVDDKEITALTAANLTMKLRQIASGFAYVDDRAVNTIDYVLFHTVKYDLLQQLYEQRRQSIMFVCGFQAEFAELKKRIPSLDCVNGKTTKPMTKQIIREWNERAIDVMALHPRTLGTGVNLQDGGNYELWISPDWSFLAKDQTIGRVHRTGQRKDVTIDYVVARDTIDELILKAMALKERTAREFSMLLKVYREQKLGGAGRRN